MTIRYYYDEYKEEIVFGFVLLLIVAAMYLLTSFIPTDIYVSIINPSINCFLIAVCSVSAWILAKHNDGNRVRVITSIAYAIWAILLAVGLAIRMYRHQDIPEGLLSIHGWEMVFGDIFAWLLLAYPMELLKPGSVTWKSALYMLGPVVLVGFFDQFTELDLRWLLSLYPMVLIVVLAFQIRGYRQWVEDNYGSMDNIDTQWIVRYLIMVAITGVSYVVMLFQTNPVRLFPQQLLVFFVLTYSVERILFRPNPWKIDVQKKTKSTRVVESVDEQPEEAEPTEIDEATMELYLEYKEELEAWMEKEKPYTNRDFKVADVMQVLLINRTYISQFFKTIYGCNFYQFVNRYRVNDAKRMIRENPHRSFTEVAEQCGFSSLTMFSRIFSRETGMTPSQWSMHIDKK